MPIVSGGGSSAAPYMQGVGLVAGYHLDENTGTSAADFTGHGHTGTLSGGGWDLGHHLYGFNFGTGANGKCAIGAVGTFYKTAFTLEAWIRKDSAQKGSPIVGSWASGSGGGPLLWIDDTNEVLSLALTNSSTNYVYPPDRTITLTTGWHHCAGTYDGTTGKLYLDGLLYGTHAFSGNVGDTNSWNIGQNLPDPLNSFDGVIDEVLIYSRALSQDEIISDMRAT